MTASRFTTSISDFPAKGSHLLFHTLTRAQVIIDDELRAAIAWVPICGDGCLFAAYLRYGDPSALFCSRRSVEYGVTESLKLSYRRKKEEART